MDMDATVNVRVNARRSFNPYEVFVFTREKNATRICYIRPGERGHMQKKIFEKCFCVFRLITFEARELR
jgi:hypothetical protein